MVLNYIFVSATSMFICYKVCANIKPATIFFCIALLITLPLLANSRWKTKFQQSLTVNTDTIPVKNIDTLSSKKIIVVGTTSLRTLESIYWLGVKLINGLIKDEWTLQQWESYELQKNYPHISAKESLQALINWLESNNQAELHCETSLIILPGYQFKIPDGLITNFHQPQSTLLLLVSAFIGEDWRKVYQHALNSDYRFLSYGDSSLLWRNA